MTFLDILAVLLGLSALFGYINYRFLGLPHTIGLVVIAMAVSLSVVVSELLLPALPIADLAAAALLRIDFQRTLMHGMLSFLLFAGALHVDLGDLRDRGWAIGSMATFGVLISTALIGTAIWLVLPLLGQPIPFLWALVFGALISPTDPVAVLSLLKQVRVPRTLEAKIAGESLFNDGVGVVVFTIVLAAAFGPAEGSVGPLFVLRVFALEVVGGALLGLIAGYLVYRALRGIDEHNIEVLLTLALVTGTYGLALHLHMSGPIAVVVAGLLIGNHGAAHAMSETTRDHLLKFWSLTDEILNSVLFLLIGLELLVIGFTLDHVVLALAAIPIVLAARWVAVFVPIAVLSLRRTFEAGTVPVLVWGGLRGGISVALALSLPNNDYKTAILAITYGVVVFAIIVQGLTVQWVVRRMVRTPG